MFNYLREVDSIKIAKDNVDNLYEAFVEENKTELQKQTVKNISITGIKKGIGNKSKWLADWFKKRFP